MGSTIGEAAVLDTDDLYTCLTVKPEEDAVVTATQTKIPEGWIEPFLISDTRRTLAADAMEDGESGFLINGPYIGTRLLSPVNEKSSQAISYPALLGGWIRANIVRLGLATRFPPQGWPSSPV